MVFPTSWVVVECAPGLEGIVVAEIERVWGEWLPPDKSWLEIIQGEIRFPFPGPLERLNSLRTALAVYQVFHFPVPRPRALLGDQNFRKLVAGIRSIMDRAARQSYQTLYISAAGKDSRILTRLREGLAAATGLQAGVTEGDLLIRLRRAPAQSNGWEALVRLTPRPLATREWRVCNYEGALNASVGRAMIDLAQPAPTDVFLNLACGSGTLLVERLGAGKARQVIGCDHSPDALACARENLTAAGLVGQTVLVLADGGAIPLPSESVNTICADLPFGGLRGSHAENIELYPRILREGARVSRPGARMVLITHEIKLLRSLLRYGTPWVVQDEIQITLSGLHPCITLLEKIHPA